MKVRFNLLLLLVFLLVVSYASVCTATRTLNVQCGGSVGDIGALTHAQNTIRSMQPLNESVVVDLSGDCVMGHDALFLDPSIDSGNWPHTITYTSSSRDARILGGSPLNANSFVPASNALLPPDVAADVLAYDLSGIDFGVNGVGELFNGGLGACGQTRTELFLDGQPMMLARYPNAPLTGGPWMEWMNVGVVHSNTTAFTGESSQPFSSRLQEDAASGNVWMHGFWAYDWADNYMRATSITLNTTNSSNTTWSITYDPSTPPIYEVMPSARFYLINSIAELDVPGEYYIDNSTHTLYFYPPYALTNSSELHLSMAGGHLGALVGTNTSDVLHDVRFEGLGFMYGSENGISIMNASRVSIHDCVVSNLGQNGVVLTGQDVVLDNITSTGLGCMGAQLSGGNTMTLEPSNITIQDSDISFYARWVRTYNPAIHFSGVGIAVTRNRVGNAPHNGMLGSGNNHVFTENYFYDLCYEVTDSGAFYVGRSWVNRGMILDSNTFVNITSLEPTVLGSPSVQAIYLDDQQSGVTMTNNLCRFVDACFMVGGGRDNVVTGNRCENATEACVLFDNRGMNWQLADCSNSSGLLVQQLLSVNYTSPPYSIEYPPIVDTMSNRPCVPVENAFVGNSVCNTPLGFINRNTSTIKSWGSIESGNTVDTNC